MSDDIELVKVLTKEESGRVAEMLTPPADPTGKSYADWVRAQVPNVCVYGVNVICPKHGLVHGGISG